MSKSAQIKLYKAHLRLQIKQQAFEIKKTTLDLRRQYDIIQLGVNFVTDLVSGDHELDQLTAQINEASLADNPALQRSLAKAQLRRRHRRQQMRHLTDLLSSLYQALQSFLSMGKNNDDASQQQRQSANTAAATAANKQADEYVVGRDDL